MHHGANKRRCYKDFKEYIGGDDLGYSGWITYSVTASYMPQGLYMKKRCLKLCYMARADTPRGVMHIIYTQCNLYPLALRQCQLITCAANQPS